MPQAKTTKKAAAKKAAQPQVNRTPAVPETQTVEKTEVQTQTSTPAVDPYRPRRNPPATRDHKALEKKRQAELDEERRVHKQRTEGL